MAVAHGRSALLVVSVVLGRATAAPAGEVEWRSPVLGKVLAGEVTAPKSAEGAALPVVVYLERLGGSQGSGANDGAAVRELVDAGHLVVRVDYGGDERARGSAMAADVLALREAIAGKRPTLLGDYEVDKARVFILPEGFRLRRDVKHAEDGKRVLGMDVMYPANPTKPVGMLMEITCDNENRMGSGSLLFCRDALLECGMLSGFAVAMVDHPVPPPYKGIDDPMPESVERMRAAVNRLREVGKQIGANGRVGAIGFSRGGPFAAILAATGEVEAALVHGNRYDYLKLREGDPMLKRFEKVWGTLPENREKWAVHGAVHYLGERAAPMFLNTSDAESPEYREGLAIWDRALTAKGVEHVYQVDKDGRGHRVSTHPGTLDAIYRFFHKHLDTSRSTTAPER